MTAQQRLTRLADLIGEAGQNYFARITLIGELLADKAWLESAFAGDDYKAAQTLEEDYLHDLAGSMSIFELLRIKQHFPTEADWKKRKYRLNVLLKDCTPEPEKRTVQRIKVSEYNQVVQKAQETEYALKVEKKTRKEVETEMASLAERVEILEEENAKLRGRIEELEHILDKRLDKLKV